MGCLQVACAYMSWQQYSLCYMFLQCVLTHTECEAQEPQHGQLQLMVEGVADLKVQGRHGVIIESPVCIMLAKTMSAPQSARHYENGLSARKRNPCIGQSCPPHDIAISGLQMHYYFTR